VTQRSALSQNSAIPWRAIAERFSSLFLILLSIALLVLGRFNAPLLDQARTRTGDAMAPVLDVVHRPLAAIRANLAVTQGLFDLAAENAHLRDENMRLKEWQSTALALEAQNRVLRGMINLGPSAPPVLRTEPVIGEPGGVYVRSVLIGGGSHDGLNKGQAAMVGPALVGRITELGNWSARVLLITDLNSRIPVVLEGTRAQAILAGDNSPLPYLMYLPKATIVSVGDRIVTAGHDGVFPTGIAVGRVASVDNGQIRIEPMATLDRLEFLTIVDNAAQSALTPEAAPAEVPSFLGAP
jgi:rod shape-determining protein MreC